MILYPKAKINAGLQIIEKRDDGFHNLESLFLAVPSLYDILEIVEAENFSLNCYGKHAVDCPAEQNLCTKAWRLLEREFKIPPVEIHLLKNIPSGAGLGGGSSDGAAALIILNRLFALNIKTEKLAGYAAVLGSDCPYFIYANQEDDTGFTPMLVSGRGDILERADVVSLAGVEIEIDTPELHISTAEAYAGATPRMPEIMLRELIKLPLEQWRNTVVNDFENHLFKKHPVLAECKSRMYNRGALYASLSGSGSSVYGLFRRV